MNGFACENLTIHVYSFNILFYNSKAITHCLIFAFVFDDEVDSALTTYNTNSFVDDIEEKKNSQRTARTYLCRWNYLPDYWWVNVEELSASSLYGCRQWNRYRRSVASPLPRHFISFMNRCGWWLLWWCALSISLAHSLDTTTVAKAIDPFTISLAVSIAAELPNSHLPCWARQTIRYGLLGGS